MATGKKIQVAAAQSNLKRVTLELGEIFLINLGQQSTNVLATGGKSPAVIFEDADIENALTW